MFYVIIYLKTKNNNKNKMCAGFIFYKKNNLEFKEQKVFFPIPNVKIPYFTNDGIIDLAYWGIRNKSEQETLKVNFPITGWAKIESIKKGNWNKYNPLKVYIPAIKFMEKDKNKNSHWFELKNDEFVLAILVLKDNLKFCYIVTMPSVSPFNLIHDRWVILVNKNFNKIIDF